MFPSRSKQIASVPSRKSTGKRAAEKQGNDALNKDPQLIRPKIQETDEADLAEHIEKLSLEKARKTMLPRLKKGSESQAMTGYRRTDSGNTKNPENGDGSVPAKSIREPQFFKSCGLKTEKGYQGRVSEHSKAVASTSKSGIEQVASPPMKRSRRTTSETFKAGGSSLDKQLHYSAAPSSSGARMSYRKTSTEARKAELSIQGTKIQSKPMAKATIEYPLEEFLYDGDIDDHTLQRNKTIPYNMYRPRAAPPTNQLNKYRCPTSTFYLCTGCGSYIKERGDFMEHVQYDCGNQYSCQCQYSTYKRRLMLTHIKKVHGDQEDEFLGKLTIIRLTSGDPDIPVAPRQFVKSVTCTRAMAKCLARKYNAN